MTRDDIIRIAKEAGLEFVTDNLEEFANLVAAAEREACAALCFQMWNDSLDRRKLNHPDAEDCAAAIRARGDALTKLNKAAEDIGEEL